MNIKIRLLEAKEVGPIGFSSAGTVWKDITPLLERYLILYLIKKRGQ